MDHSVTFRVNAQPTESQLSDLCETVGWSRFGADYAALDHYALTASAWANESRLVGWVSVVSDNVRHAFLLDVMVHPEFQRRGIGRAMVVLAMNEMRARGVTAFHVDCANDRAGFYEKCGFNMCSGGWLDSAAKP
jgi:ribosomal protein S18 acetylase RimI-like enzyme